MNIKYRQLLGHVACFHERLKLVKTRVLGIWINLGGSYDARGGICYRTGLIKATWTKFAIKWFGWSNDQL